MAAQNPTSSVEAPETTSVASESVPAVTPAAQQFPERPGLHPFYVNFARVHGSPEELVLDFALNPQPFGAQLAPLEIQRRIVLNFYTAKRLMAALSMAVQQHEYAFGVLETDVNKRVTAQPGDNR